MPPPAAVQQPPQPAAQQLGQGELEKLLAPIALYPDDLVAQILTASTYPIEVVQAARWVNAHPKVSGNGLQDAMQQQPWDPSVKGLTAVPQVLAMMNDKLDWTQQLGEAFLAQPNDVSNARRVPIERCVGRPQPGTIDHVGIIDRHIVDAGIDRFDRDVFSRLWGRQQRRVDADRLRGQWRWRRSLRRNSTDPDFIRRFQIAVRLRLGAQLLNGVRNVVWLRQEGLA